MLKPVDEGGLLEGKMNIHAYTLDSLRKLIRRLQKENAEKGDGSDAVGVYPLFPDGTCKYIVFDFDNHEKGAEKNDYANINNDWQDEVNALRKMCIDNEIEPLVERSRSGKGAHVWILFSKPVKAAAARKYCVC